MTDFDAMVVGAGAVGLATAYALARQGRDVVVIDGSGHIGEGVSSRNSEVIHAGLYYPTGSLKARLCVEGRRALYDFCEAHGVDTRPCGKLVVAQDTEEEARLEGIHRQAEENGVEGLRMLTGTEARRLEPELTASAALVSETSGVFDSHAYMLALQGETEQHGGQVALQTRFVRAVPQQTGGFAVWTGGAPDPVLIRCLVIAAGLGAQDVARGIEGYPAGKIPRLYYGKGVYFSLQGRAPFSHLVYPLPLPGALGTHYRRDLSGRGIFGPDLRFVDRPDYSVEPEREAGFRETIARFWPAIRERALVPDYAGVRPKLHGPGDPLPDWRIDGPEVHGVPGLVSMFGIESPGLTASLGIGDEVAKRLSQDW